MARQAKQWLPILLLTLAACGGGAGGGGDDGIVTGDRLGAEHNPPVASLTSITAPVSFPTLTASAMVTGDGSGPNRNWVTDTEAQSRPVTIGAGGEYGAGRLYGETERLGTDHLTPYETYIGGGTTRVLQPGDAESGLHYTSFGIWNEHYVDRFWNTYPSYGQGEAFAWGVMTADNAIPAAGSARYDGHAAIWWGRQTGNARPYDVYSDTDTGAATLNVDFGARQIAGQLNGFHDNPSLQVNLAGNYSGNALEGSVTTAGGGSLSGLSGEFAARFYGPAAEELGGVFLASGSNAAMIGAFAGQR